MSCPFVVFEAMGPPGSSPRTLGEHVGWAAGSRPLDSGAPHMVPPAAEQLGTRVSRAWHLAGFSRIPGGGEPHEWAWRPSQQDCSTFAVRGIVQHLLCRVVRQRSPCETVRSTLAAWGVRQRSPRPRPCSVLAVEPVQGPLNAPDWLAGQHADRAWPTRRRGIRMPWWCWPAGRSPCCSPRQWPPGNESPCLIPRQR